MEIMKFYCCKREFSSKKPCDLIYFNKSVIKGNDVKSAIKLRIDYINGIRQKRGLETLVFEPQKDLIRRGRKIAQMYVYSFFCPVCGCVKVKIVLYAFVLGSRLKLDTMELASDDAQEFLRYTSKLRQECPIGTFRKVESSKTIPFVYGKALSAYEQGSKYLNANGFRNRHEHKSVPKVVNEFYKSDRSHVVL